MSQNLDAPDSANGADNAALSDDTSAIADDAVLDTAASDENAEQVETQENETNLQAKADDEVIDLEEFLAEFEDKPLTRAQIDQRYPRISKEVRDGWERSETARGTLLTERQELGDHGISFAKVVSPHLSNPNPTAQDSEAVFQELADRNPRLLAAMGNLFLNEALNHEQTGEETANQIISSEFGEGYNLETLHKLVAWHKADLMDEQAFVKAAEEKGVGRPSPYEKQMGTKLEAALKEIETLKGKTSSTEQSALEASKSKSDDYIREQIMEPVAPIVDRIGWTVKDTDKPEIKDAKLALGEMVSAVLQVRAQKTAQWKHYEYLRDNNQAFQGDNPSKLLTAQVGYLGGATKAWVTEIARKLQPLINETLRYKATSRNQKTASEAATKETKTTTATAPTARQWSANNDPPEFNPDNVNKVVNQFVAAKKDSAIPVGQQRRS